MLNAGPVATTHARVWLYAALGATALVLATWLAPGRPTSGKPG